MTKYHSTRGRAAAPEALLLLALALPLLLALALAPPASGEVIVLMDAAPPELTAVRLVDRHVELELSEEPTLESVTEAVTLAGERFDWQLLADRYTVRTTEATTLLFGELVAAQAFAAEASYATMLRAVREDARFAQRVEAAVPRTARFIGRESGEILDVSRIRSLVLETPHRASSITCWAV